MNHYQQLLDDEIRTVQGQKAYCIEVLGAGGLQSWASKEYSDLANLYDTKLNELKDRRTLLSEGEL